MFSRASYHRFFFFNDTATTEIYTLPLHDALPIYILVNSAANFLPASMVSTTEEVWDASLDANLRAPFFCAQAAAPLLRRTRGTIINFSDTGGVVGWPAYIAHSGLEDGSVVVSRVVAK